MKDEESLWFVLDPHSGKEVVVRLGVCLCWFILCLVTVATCAKKKKGEQKEENKKRGSAPLGPQPPIESSGKELDTGSLGSKPTSGSEGPKILTGSLGPEAATGSIGSNQATGSLGPKPATGSLGPKTDTGSLGLNPTIGSLGPRTPTRPTEPKPPTEPLEPNPATGSLGPYTTTSSLGPDSTTESLGPKSATGSLRPSGSIGPKPTITGSIGPKATAGSIGPKATTGSLKAEPDTLSLGPKPTTGSIGPSKAAGSIGPSKATGSIRPSKATGPKITTESLGLKSTTESLGPQPIIESFGPKTSAGSLEPKQATESLGPKSTTESHGLKLATGSLRPEPTSGSNVPKTPTGSIGPKATTGSRRQKPTTGSLGPKPAHRSLGPKPATESLGPKTPNETKKIPTPVKSQKKGTPTAAASSTMKKIRPQVQDLSDHPFRSSSFSSEDLSGEDTDDSELESSSSSEDSESDETRGTELTGSGVSDTASIGSRKRSAGSGKGSTSSGRGSAVSGTGSAGSGTGSDGSKTGSDGSKASPSSEGSRKEVRAAVRRQTLPAVAEPAAKISVWNLAATSLRQGRPDLPITLYEPLTNLQRICEELEYAFLLDKLVDEPDPVSRLSIVAGFAVSAYASSFQRGGRKPFQPLLGETFHCDRFEELGWRFHAEQVQHRPHPVSACHAEGRAGWIWSQEISIPPINFKTLELNIDGFVQILLKKTSEKFSFNKVKGVIHSISSPEKRHVRPQGEIAIRSTSGHTARLNFEKGIANANTVRGEIADSKGKRVGSLEGKWSEGLSCRRGTQPPQIVFHPIPLPADQKLYYGFSKFARELNQLPFPSEVLPPTDSRRRKDVRALEEGKTSLAQTEKTKLEEGQRKRREASVPYTPNWFRQEMIDGRKRWASTEEYWKEAKNRFRKTKTLSLFD